MVLKFCTNGYNCYGIQFCPQIGHRFGCVSSQNYGIAGSGALFVSDIVDTDFGPRIECKRVFHSVNDPLYDLCWSESQPNIIWTVSANGFIQICDLNISTDRAIAAFKGHEREIYSINCSAAEPQYILSTSSDASVKIWDVMTAQPMHTFLGHESVVYCGQWSPLFRHSFASASGDSTLRIWSLERREPTITIRASYGEVLSCDWNKSNQFVVATSDTNGLINVWDIRSPHNPLRTLSGHSKAIKCVKYSPFRESVIGSVSYDMTTRLWDTNTSNGLLFTSQEHKEFVYGFDFSRLIADRMADCSWDQFVHVFSYSPQYVANNQL